MIIQSIAGLMVFVVLALAMSENRKKVSIKTVVTGLALQLAVGIVLLKLPFFRDFFLFLNRIVLSLEESTAAGTSFVFGYLGGGSLGIMIGGMGTMVPQRRNEIVSSGVSVDSCRHTCHMYDRCSCRNPCSVKSFPKLITI